MSNKKKSTEPKKDTKSNSISREEALKKMGKYAALTALGTFVVLNPLQSQESSQTPVVGPFG